MFCWSCNSALSTPNPAANGKDDSFGCVCRGCHEAVKGKYYREYARTSDDIEKLAAFLSTNLDTPQALGDSEAGHLQAKLESTRAALSIKQKQLEALPESEWDDRFDPEIKTINEEIVQFQRIIQHQQSRSKRLSRITMFKIETDGKIGMINGLRLGKSDMPKISWPELNAACGQAALLLTCLIHAYKANVKPYRLLPLGPYSRIEIGKTTLPLYYSSKSDSSSQLAHSAFDEAMQELVKCLELYASEIGTQLPLELNGFGSAQFISEHEQWNSTMLSVLKNLEYLRDL